MGKAEIHSPAEQEGVIKYRLAFRPELSSLEEVCLCSGFGSLPVMLDSLNFSRAQMLKAGLIGQDEARYGGDGFGNISIRMRSNQFVISGTQTGHLATLTERHVALVEEFDPAHNWLQASGCCEPSSEAMTHGVAYRCYDDIQAVIHVHSPHIWKNLDKLKLPFTNSDVAYGTPEMAMALQSLLKVHHRPSGVTLFGMKGHEDGVIAAGASLQACASSLLQCLAQLDSITN